MPQILPAACDPLGQTGMTKTCRTPCPFFFPSAMLLPEVLDPLRLSRAARSNILLCWGLLVSLVHATPAVT